MVLISVFFFLTVYVTEVRKIEREIGFLNLKLFLKKEIVQIIILMY